MERQKLLEMLYSTLPDKTKLRAKTTVSRIEQSPGQGVRVYTVGGDVYQADLVVGADGVHSSTRSELWKAMKSSEIDRTFPMAMVCGRLRVWTDTNYRHDCGLFVHFRDVKWAPRAVSWGTSHANQRRVDPGGDPKH